VAAASRARSRTCPTSASSGTQATRASGARSNGGIVARASSADPSAARVWRTSAAREAPSTASGMAATDGLDLRRQRLERFARQLLCGVGVHQGRGQPRIIAANALLCWHVGAGVVEAEHVPELVGEQRLQAQRARLPSVRGEAVSDAVHLEVRLFDLAVARVSGLAMRAKPGGGVQAPVVAVLEIGCRRRAPAPFVKEHL